MSNMLAIDILTGPIALMLIGYVVLMVALSFVVQPLRENIVKLSESMLDEPKWNEVQRTEIELLVESSMSFRVGLIMPIAVVSFMVDTILDRVKQADRDQAKLEADPRFESLTWRFFISAAAANPLAALVTVPLIFVSILVGLAFAKRSPRRVVETAVEEPMIRVLLSVAQGRRLAS